MADDPQPEKPTDWRAVAIQMMTGLMTEGAPGFVKAWQTAHIETHGAVRALDINLGEDVAQKMGELMHTIEEPFLPIVASFVAPILAGLFGADFNDGEFARRLARGGGTRGAAAILDGFMKAIIGDTPAEIQPSDAGAKRIAAAAVQAELESGFNALAFQMLSDMLPFDLGHFAGVKDLPEGIIGALGVHRLVWRALMPAVNTCCTVPNTWYMNKLHRPTLLGASTLAKQIARNPAKAEQWKEDLRRDGYGEDRIEALLNEQAKFHSVADLDLLVRARAWSEGQAVQHLRDQGYEDAIATTELQIEKIKRIAAFEHAMADAAVTAYAAGRINEGTLGGFITGTTISAQEKAQYDELAAARRICARQPLTPAEAAQLVKDEILSVVDYRRALERAGRDEEAVAALELKLRYEIQQEKNLEQARREQAAERAAEKAAREAERQRRLEEIAAQRALARRGAEGALEAAAVRGLIPLARVQEVYEAKYDGDTVAILLDTLAGRRADYVAQQQAAADARKRAAVRNIDVGALEQAVLQGVLTLDEFRTRLADLNFSAADAALLTATLRARLAALAAAQAARDAAAAAARVKHIDLGRMETLVRRGHRTLHDYDALLQTLDVDEASRAAMLELLQLKINDDAAAAATRAAAAAALTNKGLSLEQFRRAVVIGLTPIADYAPFLLKHGLSAAAVAVLVPELQFAVDEAVAARSRRAAADARLLAGVAPLADIRRAARLGLIPVDAYYARLRADGYTADDVAIESDLLSAEIGHDRALAAAAEARAAAAPVKGLTLRELAAAVTAGVASIGDYEARALAIGLSAHDAAILRDTLQATLDVTAVARARKQQLADEGADRELARADVEKAVRKGVTTMDGYRAYLQGAGYTEDDAALLVAVLEADLGAAGGGPSGGTA